VLFKSTSGTDGGNSLPDEFGLGMSIASLFGLDIIEYGYRMDGPLIPRKATGLTPAKSS